MSLRVPDTATTAEEPCRRQRENGDLVLSELNPSSVVDGSESADTALNLLTFGNVREVCPKCQKTHLKLVLRQGSVRMAHLFCADCTSCFDAHYTDGAPALTI